MTDETTTPATSRSKATKKASAPKAQAAPKDPVHGPSAAIEAKLLRHLRKQHGLTPAEARIQMGYGVPARATKEQNEMWDWITKIEAGE